MNLKSGFLNWSKKWEQYLQKYLDGPPRFGIWMQYYLDLDSKKIIEIAGGSCRDSRFLYNHGFNVVSSDGDPDLVAYLNEKINKNGFSTFCIDAFSTKMPSKSIDISFSNGFIGYFDDKKIIDFLIEQERVTKDVIVIAFHNAKNLRLLRRFKEKSKQDDLYSIRFFTSEEVKNIIKQSNIFYKKLSFLKFGGPLDIFYRFIGLNSFLDRILFLFVPFLYRIQPISRAERVVAVLELS